MHILEYSPTEGYHISTAQERSLNNEICKLKGIQKDYEEVGSYESYEDAFEAMEEHKELSKGNYAA